MSPTEVLVDATALGEAAGHRGVGTYIRGLLGALAARDDLHVRALHHGEPLVDGIDPILVRRRSPGRWRHLERDLSVSLEFRRHRRGAIVHSLDTEPPWRPPRPFVQTLFDVIPLLSSDPALAARRERWRSLAQRFREADRVIAISNHAADTGAAELGLDRRRIVVAPLGVDRAFTPSGSAHHEPGDEPYVLLVGEYARRKGFEEAFQVMGTLAAAGLPHRLVVAGRLVPWTKDRVRRLVASSPAPERITLAGYVDDLSVLYRGASATIVTSRAEGFGLPVIESMACGTPVVSFDNTSLPEVVGDAGLLVSDGDIDAFAATLAAVLADDGGAAQFAEAGLARAASFTWDRCAEIHAEVYRGLEPRR